MSEGREFTVSITKTYRVSAPDPMSAVLRIESYREGDYIQVREAPDPVFVYLSTEVEETGIIAETRVGTCTFMDVHTRHCKSPDVEAIRWLEFNANSVYIDAEKGSFNKYKQIWHRQTSKQLLRDAVLAEKERQKHESLANQHPDSLEKQLQGNPWQSFGEGYRHSFDDRCKGKNHGQERT